MISCNHLMTAFDGKLSAHYREAHALGGVCRKGAAPGFASDRRAPYTAAAAAAAAAAKQQATEHRLLLAPSLVPPSLPPWRLLAAGQTEGERTPEAKGHTNQQREGPPRPAERGRARSYTVMLRCTKHDCLESRRRHSLPKLTAGSMHWAGAARYTHQGTTQCWRACSVAA